MAAQAKDSVRLIPLPFENLGYWAREDDHVVVVGYKDESNIIARFSHTECTLDAALDAIINHFIKTVTETAAAIKGRLDE